MLIFANVSLSPELGCSHTWRNIPYDLSPGGVSSLASQVGTNTKAVSLRWQSSRKYRLHGFEAWRVHQSKHTSREKEALQGLKFSPQLLVKTPPKSKM